MQPLRVIESPASGEPKIAEIVAAVRLPAALQLALRAYHAARSEETAARDRLGEMVIAYNTRNDARSSTGDPAIFAAEREVTRLAAVTATARHTASLARPPYVAAVKAALAPETQAETSRVEAAVLALRQARARLADRDDQVVRAGGEAPTRRSLVQFAQLEDLLRQDAMGR